MKDSPRTLLATLLDSLLAGTLSPSEAVRKAELLPPSADDETIEEVFHALIHYREDEDIRSKDPGYADRQRRSLAKFIEVLRR